MVSWRSGNSGGRWRGQAYSTRYPFETASKYSFNHSGSGRQLVLRFPLQSAVRGMGGVTPK